MMIPKFSRVFSRPWPRKVKLQGIFERSMAQDHLQRTGENTRNEVISLASVIGMRDESKTVKFLTLDVKNKHLTFKAGQWVDMFIPGLETVGGFSMCSSPELLHKQQQLHLAVKYSKHPPAYWIHTQCKAGSEVRLRVGGDFYYDPVRDVGKDLLLIAGGVGINPLYSIIHHVADLSTKGDNSNIHRQSRVILLYSARTDEELIFKNDLRKISSNVENINCQYFITREKQEVRKNSDVIVNSNRISQQNIEECFTWLRKDKTVTYLCGPSSMITDMESLLHKTGVDEANVRYEKWW